MGHYRENLLDGTTFEFARPGFWLVHIFGTAAVFLFGMRFAARRAPLPFVAYRILRMLSHR